MEKVADTILFPCKYQTNGCLLNLIHKNKLEHEDGCDFRPVTSKLLSFFSCIVGCCSSTCVLVQVPHVNGKGVWRMSCNIFG